MKKLCVVRHGYYDFQSGHLSNAGKQQAKDLAVSLKKAVGVVEPTIISSDIIRAAETAQIIAEKFGAPVNTHRFLSCDEIVRKDDMNKVWNLVRHHDRHGVECLILVTHEVQATHLPVCLGFSPDMPAQGILEGTGWVLDYATKTFRFIP